MFDEFEGAPNVMHVSTEGDDANDGLTWATAKRTVAGALAEVGNNVLVLVAPGAHTGSFTINGAGPDKDANVTICGAGWGTRTEDDEFAGIASVKGSNVTIQDIQLFNTGPDSDNNRFYNAVHAEPESTLPLVFPRNLTVRRVSAHGAAALLLHSSRNWLLESIFDGFENALAGGRFVASGAQAIEFSTLSSMTIYRTVRTAVDYDADPVHFLYGSITALSCHFSCIAGAPVLTAGYRGILLDEPGSYCLLFGCTVGVAKTNGQISGATFGGIAGSGNPTDGARLKTTACAVRAYAIGAPSTDIASIKALSPGVVIDADWTLRIPP